ncbi:hypothetical protein JW964_12785, partial [candidate division KSB1 bacterium]|nr:hypothetical protein [candidate division KSB1 bacterium]
YHHFSKTVSLAKKYGLKIVAYLIIGLPEDTLDQMMDDIIFLAGLPVLIGPSIFYPPPGSMTFENCVNRGYISGNDYSLYRSSAVPVETENFSRQDLITLFRLTRAINFIKHTIDQNDTRQCDHLRDFINREKITNQSLLFDHKLTADEIGILLLDQLFQKGQLKGLLLNQRTSLGFLYDWITYKISEELVQFILTKLIEKSIGGIYHSSNISI